MVAFRKWFPVLAIVGLILSSAGLGQAQTLNQPFSCEANAGVPPIVRAEGFTELTGDLLLTCTGGDPTQAFVTNFQIFLNTNITSRLLSNVSEALLLVDEPLAPRTTGTPTPFCLQPNANGDPGPNVSAPGPASCVGAGIANPLTAGATFQTGTYTVMRAVRAGASESSLVWPGVTIVPPGTNGTRILRFTNIRANAAGLGVSSTLIPSQVTALISASPANSVSINNPQQTVGFVSPGLQFDVRNCSNTGAGSANFFQCVGQNPTLISGTTGTAQFALRFREGFQQAFKLRIAAGQSNSIPGSVFASESGFVRNAASPTLPDNIGYADSATRVAARFNNVPAGVRIWVTVNPVFAPAGATGLSTPGTGAQLVQTDLAGATTSASPIAGTATLSCATASYASGSAAEIPVAQGTGLAVWEVTAANSNIVDELVFAVGVAYTPNTGATPPVPALGQSTVTGNFAPFYAATTASTTMGALPIPRFLDNPVSANTFRIDTCVTNLLFPFVTNQAGFDSGIAIANTSSDPFGTARQQSGPCTLNYYGSTTGGGAAPAAQTTNAPVPTGQQLTFVLSSGGGLGIAGTPGFQGYIIAQCQFQYAHGFAFITDGPIGQARVAEGYLALILDSAVAARGSLSEVLGN